MRQAHVRDLQLSVKRHRIAARKRVAGSLGRAVDLFLIVLAVGIAALGFVFARWTGLIAALALIALAAGTYHAVEWLKGALLRVLGRRAIRRWQVEAAADRSGPQVDAWVIAGGGNVLIADVARRAILLNARSEWQAFRMDELKRVDVVRRRGRLGRIATALHLSDEYAGPPLLELDVVDGDAERFAKVVRARVEP